MCSLPLQLNKNIRFYYKNKKSDRFTLLFCFL